MEKMSLIQKYNVPAPRYTSYPAVPHWNNFLDPMRWKTLFQQAYSEFGEKEGMTLYIHLPFCESLCTYCGCNKRITQNHKVELPYISSLMKEWNMYLDWLDQKPKLAGIHLGGGTPTFFAPETLNILLKHLGSTSTLVENPSFSFEGHPNNTTEAHLETLARHGFTRVSFGIQDFDPQVQQTIHRIQPFEKVKQVTESSRRLGYTSVNFDLIYGLPHQTLDTLKDTFAKVQELLPERIAFYSYAHLPSAFPAQKSFEAFLPKEDEKRALYEQGKTWLEEMGYEEIGMDHFALPGDPLLQAKKDKTLHRNFMGYTTSPSRILLGLGCSAISDIYHAYGQNEKSVEAYKKNILMGELPLIKGHVQTEENLKVKAIILQLICNRCASWTNMDELPDGLLEKLLDFETDGLIAFDQQGMHILDEGKPFVRNICMAFDPYMSLDKKSATAFSKAI
ncbi:oxygen-independent coproporphyrinogen III oxidase [Cyclobacterium xiamenense]|uniref:oxygen-independent coproporphyrinogen III oxidase n=1 Tax=Cyclobacterium xiamenense TaxID=1297121 RepID=UPI0012B9CE16|nr:oxygen-independent coproporphyrinogen III oxidase [Cyclobacterium xiamenense]